MGTGWSELSACGSGCAYRNPGNGTIGHIFHYIPPCASRHRETEGTPTGVFSKSSFSSIFGASVISNASGSTNDQLEGICRDSTFQRFRVLRNFDSSSCFVSVPLHPSEFISSSPIESGSGISTSGPLNRSHSTISRNSAVSRLTDAIQQSFSERKNSWVVPIRYLARRKHNDPSKNVNKKPEWIIGGAGEDRLNVVVMEEQGWLFVGVYDGFNGHHAADFLMYNLYSEVQKRIREQISRQERCTDHNSFLIALSGALEATEEDYLQLIDKASTKNPQLTMTGSCVLFVVIKDENVYLMNVGDSRAIVARCENLIDESNTMVEKEDNGGLEESTGNGDDTVEMENRAGSVTHENHFSSLINLTALQLTNDHNTNVDEEVRRIRQEHPDDDRCIVNQKVKGRLKVTRAFGAGYLKKPQWNNGLFRMYRMNYIGTEPYISCLPSLCHHILSPDDQFLVVSSDGLYEYFSNQEVVSHVKNFMETFPDGDPAQHLIEEFLSRAAQKAGMEFRELLSIPQGHRRDYHDDVTVIIISFEGRNRNKCNSHLR